MQLEIASALRMSEFLDRERFNRAGAHRDLFVDVATDSSAFLASPGGPFDVASAAAVWGSADACHIARSLPMVLSGALVG